MPGVVQESGVSSLHHNMGAPLILTKNWNNLPENLNPVVVEEQTLTEVTEQKEDVVNENLDVSIRESSIMEKSETTTIINQLNDLKHNYH